MNKREFKFTFPNGQQIIGTPGKPFNLTPEVSSLLNDQIKKKHSVPESSPTPLQNTSESTEEGSTSPSASLEEPTADTSIDPATEQTLASELVLDTEVSDLESEKVDPLLIEKLRDFIKYRDEIIKDLQEKIDQYLPLKAMIEQQEEEDKKKYEESRDENLRSTSPTTADLVELLGKENVYNSTDSYENTL